MSRNPPAPAGSSSGTPPPKPSGEVCFKDRGRRAAGLEVEFTGIGCIGPDF